MKKKSVIRPVSEKAYQSFIFRINALVHGYYERKEMIAILDRYLDGEREDYCRGIEKEYVLAFEMLRFEIDAAILRSTRARKRKAKHSDSATKVSDENLSRSEEKIIQETAAVNAENEGKMKDNTEAETMADIKAEPKTKTVTKACIKPEPKTKTVTETRVIQNARGFSHPAKSQPFHRSKPRFMQKVNRKLSS